MNKEYGTSIIVSEQSKMLTDDIFVFRYLGHIQIRGKTEFENIYEPIGLLGEISDYEKSYYKNFSRLQLILEENNLAKSPKAIKLLKQYFPDVADPIFAKIQEGYVGKKDSWTL